MHASHILPLARPTRRALAAVLLAGPALAFLPGASRWITGKAVPVPESDVCLVAPPTPYDPASGLPLAAARPVPAGVRCPVCGMYPARAPNWAAQIIFANGDAQFFDSPLSLFMYLNNVGRYTPGRSADDIVARYVTDFGSLQMLNATNAFYVVGSSAHGPMRAGNLPAFASEQAARAFAAQRGGEVRAFAGIDAALVQRLGGRATHTH
ncbi:nitrous oxide reductase accessory protein NosL [Simplicispira hankyongi]|uniref:Nitrous oxide reductase accessory protein NosL n=1 Tax=Simplicispira hankyongi TaxID=2315688 RepID=A0A398CBB7_9BURK|nr:nitrous oxide reductase accessory protein NosL [Simplicispira hankyongi]RID97620.1 hypothetical protein D3F03_12325 [Simplicispira hankyongi]